MLGETCELAERKWLVRREGNESWHGWIVTAPSGERRWFFTWDAMVALVPFFVLGEKCPQLRALLPAIYDAGIKV